MHADRTRQFLQSLVGYPEQGQEGWGPAPTLDQLPAHMQAPQKHKDGSQARLPVADQLYHKLVAQDADLREALQPVSECNAHELSHVVTAALSDDMEAPGNEIVLAGDWFAYVCTLLKAQCMASL